MPLSDLAPAHVCAALRHLRQLETDEIGAALSQLSPALRAECLRAARLRIRASDPLSKMAKLLRARLASVDGRAAHAVAVALTDPARAELLVVVGEDETLIVDEVAQALGASLAAWPRPMLAALFALLGELGAYSAATRDALLALLEHREVRTAERPRHGNDDSSSCPTECARRPAPAEGLAEAQNDLDTVLADALLRAHAGSLGPSRDQVRAAVDELLALDGRRLGSWRLRGVADGLGGSWRKERRAPTPDTAYAWFTGVIAGCAHTGNTADLGELAMGNGKHVKRLLSDLPEAASVEPLVAALLDRDPASVRRLLAAVPAPFPRWQTLIARLETAASTLAKSDPIAAAGLLRAGDDMLTSWTPAVAPTDLAAVESAAAGLAVERAVCQRLVGDFRGARSILDRVDPRAVTAERRSRLFEEVALVKCEVASLESIRFASSTAEREVARERFARAAADIEAAVASGSALVAPVLRAALAAADGKPRAAVADLLAACTALAEASDAQSRYSDLRSRLEFQLGLNELCLLEPGTDEAAVARIEAALAAGHQPPIGDLSTIAVALDAHGSPRTVEAVTHVLALEPSDHTAIEMLIALARRGAPGAGRAAWERASDERLPRRTRFDLLDGALTAAEACLGDQLDLEQLVDDLERVVAKAADPELDDRWAMRLGGDDALRSALGPDALDLVRLQVLRRSGNTDGAVAVARQLFHRSLAGHVEGVDAEDLLELLGDQGATHDEVARLRRLLPTRAAPTTTSDVVTPREEAVRVLFVGGNETQVRARSAVEAAIAATYGATVTVEWFAPGWGSNWADAAGEIESRFGHSDVLVLMTFVRTTLGRRLRRSAGEARLPWVACTGHGRASMERAIDRAVALSRLQSADKG